jgi:hypothetical protein
MRRSPLRIVGRIAVAVLAALLLWFLLGLHFFVFPRVDPVPQHADVVFALGPPLKERIATVERLLKAGKVDAALISVPSYAGPPSALPICQQARVICADPSPETTQGEARMLRRYAKQHDWSSAVVVTMTAHISRAREIIDRCYSGSLAMIPSGEAPAHSWTYQFFYQTGATLKSWVRLGC